LTETVDGVLVLHRRAAETNASTIVEHVDAFERHARVPLWTVNTDVGFPAALGAFRFSVIVLHYSLFAPQSYYLNKYFLSYLEQTGSYKVAFFQDEHHYCRDRFDFLDRYRVDCVYTLLESEFWPQVYGKYTSVPKLVYGIPGYVSDDLVQLAAQVAKPDDEREIDIGYRGRTLKPYMGKGSQEKAEIGTGFLERARGSGLKLDIAVDEESRIYGDAWPAFLANCRAVLGTEAGVSIFDTDDVVRTEYERSGQVLDAWEDNIYYRTVSPRHFEAAALGVCQILFEGRYGGILRPMVHYIPLEKDFANLDEVLRRFRDPELRHRLTENAYADLIASGQYSYAQFIESFETELAAAGHEFKVGEKQAKRVTAALARGERRRTRAARLDTAMQRLQVARVIKPVFYRGRDWHSRWKYRRFERRLASRGEN
jgi:hypothetical protein